MFACSNPALRAQAVLFFLFYCKLAVSFDSRFVSTGTADATICWCKQGQRKQRSKKLIRFSDITAIFIGSKEAGKDSEAQTALAILSHNISLNLLSVNPRISRDSRVILTLKWVKHNPLKASGDLLEVSLWNEKSTMVIFWSSYGVFIAEYGFKQTRSQSLKRDAGCGSPAESHRRSNPHWRGG